MKAVLARSAGGPEMLEIVDRPDPEVGAGQLGVRVAATAVNRADILQRQGRYPPPPGATDVLGLEVAGTVDRVGTGVDAWAVGDEVCAVLPGGGYAERVALPSSAALPLPPGLTLEQAAAVPEAFATAYDNLLVRGRLKPGETALIHGGASGVGTAAIQLAHRHGATVLVTARTAERVHACRAFGADGGFAYPEADIAEEVSARTDGRGADVILDVVGGAYLEANVRSLAVEGRLVVIGLQGGATGLLDLARMLSRRLSVTGSTLRARSEHERAPLLAGLLREVWPGFADGSLRPVIDRVMPLEAVADAHRLLEASDHVGKIVLRVG